MDPRPLRFLALCVAAAMALSGCATLGGDESTLILGDPKTSGLSSWPGIFSGPMDTYDLDGDGTLEIIAHSSDEQIYVFSSETGKALAVLPTKYPPAWYIDQILNGIHVTVLEPDEPPTILVVNHASYVTAWKFLPDDSSNKEFKFEKSWEVRTNECYRHPGNDGDAVPVDLTGDGKKEILVQTEEQGIYALKSDGTTLWSHCWGGGNGPGTYGDLDGDGDMEVVFASDGGLVSVFDGKDGHTLWTFDARAHGIHPAAIPVAPTIADITGDGLLDILFIARHVPEDNPDRFEEFNMGIFAIRQSPQTGQGELLWMRQPEWANPMSYTHLVVHDVDEDGRADIFGMDWNTVGHRPGNWENLGPANAFRLAADGSDVWVRQIDTWWSNDDIAIAAVAGEGELEVVVTGQRGGADGFWRLSPENGKSEGWLGVPGWQVQGGPNFLDLHGDGSMHLVYRAVPADGPEDRGGIILMGLDVPHDAPVPGYG